MTCAEKQYLVAYLREAAEDGGEVAPEKLARAADALEAGPADTARVDALARMVQESAERGETVELDQRGTGGVSLQRWCPLNAVTEIVSIGSTLRDAIDAAVAAQGGDECE